MKRRAILSALAGGAAGLAGCVSPLPGVGIGGDDPATTGTDPGETTGTLTTVEGPARFADARIDGPAEATVGEPVELTVSVANVGGRPGEFTGTLRTDGGDRDRSATVSIGAVEPGTRGSTTVPVPLDRPGEYDLELAGGALDPVTHSVTVTPVRAGVGEAATAGDLRATLRDLSFPWAVPYTKERRQYEDTRGVAGPPLGRVFAVGTWTFENRGDGTVGLDPSALRPTEGSVLTRVGPVGVSRVATEGPDWVTAAGLELAPGESATRRVLLGVDREAAADGVTVGLLAGAGDGPPTAVFEAVPEDGSFAFPSFELVGLDRPETLDADAPSGRVAVTVENTGTTPATFHGAIQWRDGTEWRSDLTLSPDAFAAELAPGETREFVAEWTGGPAARGRFTYRIAPFGRQFQVVFE